MDAQTLGFIAMAVAVVAVVLYVWDRRNKQEPVDWSDAAKLAAGAGSIAGGVVYAVGSDAVDAAVEVGSAAAAAAQDMFVGRPAF